MQLRLELHVAADAPVLKLRPEFGNLRQCIAQAGPMSEQVDLVGQLTQFAYLTAGHLLRVCPHEPDRAVDRLDKLAHGETSWRRAVRAGTGKRWTRAPARAYGGDQP